MLLINISNVLYLTSTIFFIGLIGIAHTRKNILITIMSIELLLLAVNLNFAICSVYLDDMVGHVFVLFILALAAAGSTGLSVSTKFTFYVTGAAKLDNKIIIKRVRNFNIIELNPVLNGLLAFGDDFLILVNNFVDTFNVNINFLSIFSLSFLLLVIFTNFLLARPSVKKVSGVSKGEAARRKKREEKKKDMERKERKKKIDATVDKIRRRSVCKGDKISKLKIILVVDNNYPCLLYPSTKIAILDRIQIMIGNPLVQVTVHPNMPMGYSPLGSLVHSGRFEYIITEVSITPNYSTHDVCNVTVVERLLCECRDLLSLDNINSYILDNPSPEIDFDDTLDNSLDEQLVTRMSPSLKKLQVPLMSPSDWFEIIKYCLTFWMVRKPTDPNNAVDIDDESYPYTRREDFESPTDDSLDSDYDNNNKNNK